MPRSLPLIAIFFAAQAIVANADTQTTCDLLHPFTRYVGTDAQCTDSTIQSAIDAVPINSCPKTIFVTTEQSYFAQHLTISGKTFALVGSTSACGSSSGAPAAPVVTLSGSGNGGHSVIDIGGSGNNITLKYVEISEGNPGAGNGGGIRFDGTGSLTLDTDTIDNNSAGNGGGVAFNGNGGAATLTLKNYTLILNNTAGNNGGGVRIEGSARLFMLEAGSTIAFNHADSGYGGGIEVLGPARVDIGSSGAVIAGAVSDNTAFTGGGLAILATAAGSAVARFFTTDPSQPVQISQNSATDAGGAAYLKPDAQNNVDTTATLCAYDFRIDSNQAPEGAAIYADTDSDQFDLWGSSLFLNSGQCGPEPADTLGAVACARDVPCSEFADNATLDSLDQVTNGSVIYGAHVAAREADRFSMRGNQAAQLIFINDVYNPHSGFFSNCLIVDNHTTHELLHLVVDIGLVIDNCTFANNTIDNGYVFFAEGPFDLERSIIFQPGRETLDYVDDSCSSVPSCAYTVEYVVATETGTLGPGAVAVTQSSDPRFVDATNPNVSKRDYHLSAWLQNGGVTASPAIDIAPSDANHALDLDGNAHDQDVPAVPDVAGVRDLGCYEAQPIIDRVFGDAFGDGLSLVR